MAKPRAGFRAWPQRTCADGSSVVFLSCRIRLVSSIWSLFVLSKNSALPTCHEAAKAAAVPDAAVLGDGKGCGRVAAVESHLAVAELPQGAVERLGGDEGEFARLGCDSDGRQSRGEEGEQRCGFHRSGLWVMLLAMGCMFLGGPSFSVHKVRGRARRTVVCMRLRKSTYSDTWDWGGEFMPSMTSSAERPCRPTSGLVSGPDYETNFGERLDNLY